MKLINLEFGGFKQENIWKMLSYESIYDESKAEGDSNCMDKVVENRDKCGNHDNDAHNKC